MSQSGEPVNTVNICWLPYEAGELIKLEFGGYSPQQEQVQQALEDTYYSLYFGFDHTRLPDPAQAMGTGKFHSWQDRVISAWEGEATRRDAYRSRGLCQADMPDSLWQYFYQACGGN